MTMAAADAPLFEMFEHLETPTLPEDERPVYVACPIPFSDSYRLAKDSNGAPALLIQISCDDRTISAPIRLRHLSVVHDVDCLIHRRDCAESGRFSVLSCLEADRATETYFLRVLEALLPSLGEFPNPFSVNEAIERLVELFRALGRPPMKRTQGLWAELLLIAESNDPVELVDAWHNVPNDLYDFGKGEQRIEVKSTLNESRIHHFSLAQLQPREALDLMVASVMVNRVGGGTTIPDLLDELRHPLSGEPRLLLRLYRLVAMTLGDRWRESRVGDV